jgi:hypothetical protein
MLPAFAGGGMVGGAPVNLHLDGQSFAMQAGEGTVDALVRHARRKACAARAACRAGIRRGEANAVRVGARRARWNGPMDERASILPME